MVKVENFGIRFESFDMEKDPFWVGEDGYYSWKDGEGIVQICSYKELEEKKIILYEVKNILTVIHKD